MTLDDLRQRYVDAIRAYSREQYAVDPDPQMIALATGEGEIRRLASMRGRYADCPEERVWRAARLLLMAMDEGMDAALLWKLAQP